MLQKDTRFPDDKTYYEDKEFLSSSSLSNFVHFDNFGNAIYNFSAFLNPKKVSGVEVTIGSFCDAILTEGKQLSDLITKAPSKAELQELCDFYTIEYKGTTTIEQLRILLIQRGHKFSTETDAKSYNKITTACNAILDRAKNFQVDLNTSFMDYIKECETQFAIADDGLGMRGKFDFFNHKRGRIIDLKTTGNLDRLLKELIYRNEINVYHKYTRQLSIYQRLAYYQTGEKYTCELAIIDHKGEHILLRIGQEALDLAWEQVEKDIDMLQKFGSKEITDYAITLTATRKEPGTVVQNVVMEVDEVDDDEEQLA